MAAGGSASCELQWQVLRVERPAASLIMTEGLSVIDEYCVYFLDTGKDAVHIVSQCDLNSVALFEQRSAI